MVLDIFVPFYGDPEVLLLAVESVRRQDSGDWRLTVVDDCYPDTTVGERVAALGDDRVRYVRNETNLGITGNFARCAELATADRVVIMGYDDVLLPNYVSTIAAAHEAYPQADIIQPGVRVIDETGADSSTLADWVKQHVVRPRGDGRMLLSGERLAASLLHGDWLYWPSLAFRRETLQAVPFRAGLAVIQDLALEIDIVLAGGTLLYEPTVCFAYRRHTSSASSAKLLGAAKFTGEREYFTLAAALFRRRGWRRAERAARLHLTSRAHALTLLPSALVARETATTKALLSHAFRPLQRRVAPTNPSEVAS
ncbi:glycosyltransferase family 2 protein [Georgenia thermotolerans]|uniref:Glycosyltransferase n=1 Tax=Georgenia thermotolerans TaxID=527326 RepID=A0A7J5UQH4_9MICO|nr:glycosyltransferase [Georgenia thermotolerans]KAE8764557.1 glycosyltransferase [Georgenia thermotolerans]